MAIELISNRERGLSVRTKLNAAIREANKVEQKAGLQALLDHINNSNNPHNIQPENIGAERAGVAFELLLQHANSAGNVHGVPSGEAVEWKSSAQGKADAAQANAKAYTDTELSAHVDASDPHTQYQLKSSKGQANGYAGLDGNAKVPESLLPAIAITEVFPVADIAARDALTVQIGDVAVVADASADPNVEAGAASYIYDGADWLQLRNPDFPVVSVNGQVGSVSLSASDVNADEAGTAVQVVGTHSAKSGDVHGVPVGEAVEWQAGAQAKATAALTSANAYTDTHANKTGDTHGVPAGQLIEWKASAQAKADAALTSANAYTYQHEQRQDNPHGVTAAQVGADPAGTAVNVMDNHLSAANPHTQYVTSAQAASAAPVQSVHGRTGNVTGQTGDYTYDQVGADQSGAAAQALTSANAYTDQQIGDINTILDAINGEPA